MVNSEAPMTQHSSAQRAHFSAPIKENPALPTQQYIPHPSAPLQPTHQAILGPNPLLNPVPTPAPAPQNPYPSNLPYQPQPYNRQPYNPVSYTQYPPQPNAYPTHAYPTYPSYPHTAYTVYPQAPYQQFPVNYPQLAYQQAPQIVYPQTVYPQIPYAPYPQTILPPPKLPIPERENEISAHGYKESLDYPLEQARKERIIARIVFFSVIALLLTFFFSPLLTFVLPETINAFHAILITFGFEIILIIVFSLILRHAFPQGLRESLGLKKPRGAHVLIGIGSAFGALCVAFVGAVFVIALGGNFEDNPQAESYANLPDWQALLVVLICVPLIAPLLEELLFRGILVGSAVRAFPGRAGFFAAIIVTGLVFGSLHFPGTFDILGAFVVILISSIGIFLAWLRLTFNSALVTMVTHAVYNGSLAILGIIGSLAGVVAIPPLF